MNIYFIKHKTVFKAKKTLKYDAEKPLKVNFCFFLCCGKNCRDKNLEKMLKQKTNAFCDTKLIIKCANHASST